MASLPADLYAMKDSLTYQPILRSVLKSQIQLLVEQLCETGEETLILTANISDGLVGQLGSESGKKFVELYDDFKSEFLGFCQKRNGKRKLDSPQKTIMQAKKVKQSPSVSTISKPSLGLATPQSVPKVSSARILPAKSPTSHSMVMQTVPGNHVIFVSAAGEPIEQYSESGYSQIENTELGYAEIDEIDDWVPEQEVEESTETVKPDDQGPSTSGEVKISVQPKDTVSKEKNASMGFLCNFCNMTFHDKATLVRHSVRHGTKQLHCHQCSELFFTDTELKQHENLSHDKERIDKPPKNQPTDTPINFGRMFNKASSCPECGKLFMRPDAREIHMLSHTGENPFTCHICGQGYRKKVSYDKHMMKKHPCE